MRKIYIYILGITPLGFFHEQLKSAAPNGAVFLLGGLAYLVLLRLVAEKFGKP